LDYSSPGSASLGSVAPLWSIGLTMGLSAVASSIFAYIYFLLLNFSRVKLLQTGNGEKKKIEGYIDNYFPILNTVLTIEILFKVVFILSTYLFISDMFSISVFKSLLSTSLICIIWFILMCRILPAEIGSRYEEKVLLKLLPVISVLTKTLAPVVFFVSLFRKFAQRITGPANAEEEAEHLTEEILDAVEESEREGVLREDEADMIEGIMELRDCEVSEIMIPRLDMVCVEISTPLSEVIKTAVEAGHSRIPVYKDTRDNVVGILYVKDLLELWRVDDADIPPLTKLVRKPFFIPETKQSSGLLADFRENKVHMAIVLDEYGGTAGLVTNEDILEEIVGEIVDEFDHEEEEELKIIEKGRKAEASGKVHIDKINEEMEINLPESDDFDTLAGLIFAELGKVPSNGDTICCDNVELTVLDAGDRRIKRIAIEVDISE